MRFMPPRRMARTAMPSMIPRCRCRLKSQPRRCRIWPCASARERANQAVHWIPALMNFRSLASALCVVASFTSVYAQTSDLTTIARLSGTPDIPGLKMIWLAPWGEVSKAHPWRNIIVHQTEAQVAAWRILVALLRTRYGIPLERVYAHNWIDYKDARYCEGCALATLARQWGE